MAATLALLQKSEVAQLWQVQIQVDHRLAMQLLNEILNDTFLLFGLEVAHQHMNIKERAFKEAEQASLAAFRFVLVKLAGF